MIAVVFLAILVVVMMVAAMLGQSTGPLPIAELLVLIALFCLFFGEVKNEPATKQMCVAQGINCVLCFLGCCEVCESETASATVHLLGHTDGTQLPVSTK